MFSPAELGAQMQPGDKISMTFSKAKAEPGGSFLDNAQSAGLVPSAAGAAPNSPASAPMGGVAPSTGGVDPMLTSMMRQKLGL